MSATRDWQYLAPKPGSLYRQLFIKGTRIMARILYGMYVREEDPATLEEIATAFRIPVEAVQEAIAYCQSDPPEIREDWEREETRAKSASQRIPIVSSGAGAPSHEPVSR
jgi:uncharacterized protein (DUF433 family)